MSLEYDNQIPRKLRSAGVAEDDVAELSTDNLIHLVGVASTDQLDATAEISAQQTGEDSSEAVTAGASDNDTSQLDRLTAWSRSTLSESSIGDDLSGSMAETVEVPDNPLRGVRKRLSGLHPEDVDAVVDDLRARLVTANLTIARFMATPGAGRQLQSLDEAETLALAGYEAARIIRTSRERSSLVLGEARREFDRLLDEGNEYVRNCRAEAERIVAEAETLASEVTRAGELRAAEIHEDITRESADARNESRRRLNEADKDAALLIQEAQSKADALLAEAEERERIAAAEHEATLARLTAELEEMARVHAEQLETDRKAMLVESEERIAKMKIRYNQMVEAYEAQRAEFVAELSYHRNLLVRYLKDADKVRASFFDAYHGVGSAVGIALRNLNGPVTDGLGLIGSVDEQIAVIQGKSTEEPSSD
jgi:hypothetical protein